jgi:hypothetical protein
MTAVGDGRQTRSRPSSLLSVEASTRQARRLQCWSTADQARLVDGLRTVLDAWSSGWSIAGGPSIPDDNMGESTGSTPGFHCRSASSALREAGWTDPHWHPLDEATAGIGLWWTLHEEEGSADRSREIALHGALFREAPSVVLAEASLAQALIRAAWLDWCQRLGHTFASPHGRGDAVALGTTLDPVGTDHVTARSLRPWSGALIVSMPWCARTLSLLIAPERVACFLRCSGGRPEPRPAAGAVDKIVPLTSLATAMSTRTVALRAELCKVEIDLGTLRGLRPGDVVRTSHRLDAPLQIVTLTPPNSGSPLPISAGFLGRQDGHRAIELLSNIKPA